MNAASRYGILAMEEKWLMRFLARAYALMTPKQRAVFAEHAAAAVERAAREVGHE